MKINHHCNEITFTFPTGQRKPTETSLTRIGGCLLTYIAMPNQSLNMWSVHQPTLLLKWGSPGIQALILTLFGYPWCKIRISHVSHSTLLTFGKLQSGDGPYTNTQKMNSNTKLFRYFQSPFPLKCTLMMDDGESQL